MFEFYSKIDDACFAFTFPLEVTNLKKYCKENDISFYYSLIYLSIKVLEGIDEFHYKITKDNKVYYYDNLIPSFTDFNKDSKSYYIVTYAILENENIIDFTKRMRKLSKEQKVFINEDKYDLNELVYITSIPWFDYTSLKEEHNNNSYDSIPHLSWGKYYNEGNKLMIHYSIQANHRLVDGYHIGLFVNGLQDLINSL